MNLWTYLQQATYLKKSDPDFVLGTGDVQAWVRKSSGEIIAHDVSIIDQIAVAMQRHHQGASPRLVLHTMADHAAKTGTLQALSREISDGKTAADGQTNDHKLGMYRRGIHSAVGVGVNMTESAYPVCRHYYDASNIETEEGFTWDFVNKHLSLTDRQSKKVAQSTAFRRIVQQKGGFAPLTASSTIDGEAWDGLQAEIKGRTQEFIDTYVAISKYYVERMSHYSSGLTRQTGTFALIDGVTFTTKNRYLVHAFSRPKGTTVLKNDGMKQQYVKFSLAFSKKGNEWAIHHFAGGTDDRTPVGGMPLQGFSAALAKLDSGTHFPDPFPSV